MLELKALHIERMQTFARASSYMCSRTNSADTDDTEACDTSRPETIGPFTESYGGISLLCFKRTSEAHTNVLVFQTPVKITMLHSRPPFMLVLQVLFRKFGVRAVLGHDRPQGGEGLKEGSFISALN